MRLASNADANADARRIRHVNLDRVMFNFPIWFQALVGTVAGVRVANAVGLGGSFAVWLKGPRLESPGQRPGDARHDLDVFLGP